MCNLLGWIILGGLAGWLASLITGRNQRQGCLMNIIVGVIGAFVGGVIWNVLSGQGFRMDFNVDITSVGGFLISVFGAVVLLVIVNLVTKRR